ncbi:MAG: hypothetical protein LBC71_01725 [Oscillospiraceae bacterium]|jgi:hypothetical protein|nr:hypothetical protein [Oscillospiraceae bacterium]
MSATVNQSHTYKVGNINFIVTPVYKTDGGEQMHELLLKLMKAEIDFKN